MIGIVLWETINAGWIHQLNTDGSAGHDFENQIVKRTHTAISKISGLKALPPRTTLSLPTVSGLQHQIDVVVRDGASIYHFIECKFKKSFDIEEIYALNAKLLDYTFGAMKYGHNHVFKGYFLAGLCEVNDNFYQYALAWGITPVVLNGIPPLEYLLHTTPEQSPLWKQIDKLCPLTSGTDIKRAVRRDHKAELLLTQWKTCYLRWKQEGYGT